MKNATGISRWTSAGRNHAVHILNDEGSLVLCEKQFFSHNTSALDIEKVTCARCLAIFKKLNIADVSNWRFIKNNEENLKAMPNDRDFEVMFDTGEVCKYSEDFPFAEVIAWRELACC